MARIFLVDDDAAALGMVQRGLEAEGHQIQPFGDGREALVALTADPAACDMLISDISMPDLDGVSLAEEVGKLWPQLAVLLMSGLAGELSRAEALKSDRLRIISKPASLDTIRAQVKALLG
jgi:DNA-binding response OmpR family regulator